MGFIKDGESKVYKNQVKTGGSQSSESSKREDVRYTIDDLVRDTDESESDDSGEEDVSH